MRILIVDDDRRMTTIYREDLLNHFHLQNLAVEEAHTFSRCLEKLQHTSVEILIVDLKIPGPNGEEMGGFEIIQESIALDLLRPIIVITGYGSIERARNSFKQGVFDFIEKGSKATDKLIDAVQRAINRRDERIVRSGNPFNLGINPTIFGGRMSELEFLEKRLNRALNSQFCEPFLVLGDWGIGKSTLLKEYKTILQNRGHLAAIVPLGPLQNGTDLQEAADLIVDGMLRSIPRENELLKQLAKYFGSINVSYAGINVESKNTEPPKQLRPQAFLHDTFYSLWQDLKSVSGVFVLLLDDLDNFRTIPEILLILRQTLQMPSLQDAKIIIGIAATPAGWQHMTTHEQAGNTAHHPLNRFFMQRVLLEPLSQQEVTETIIKSLAGTGVSFSPETIARVFENTGGHPYEVQIMCYHLFDNQLSRRVEIDVWDKSLQGALRDLGVALFDSWFNQASSEEAKVLRVIAGIEESISTKEIQDTLTSQKAGVSNQNIAKYLQRLCTKNLICKTGRGYYAIPDAMFRSYVRLRQE